MASITKKNINGHQYYYARECRRVNGKPKIVWQKYLGKADDIIKAMAQIETPEPQEADVVEFGLTAALYDVATRLNLVDIIDWHCSKREQGITVGQYMLLAAINRCSDPKSKSRIAEWYEKTVLHRLLPVSSKALTSQRFWDNMTLLTAEKIRAIEKDLAEIIISQEGVGLECLLYDTTNFFTYIDTDTKADIPQRGHNKQKRDDLRQIGLALLVSRDFHIPLLHDVYSGNVHDSTQFTSVTEELVKRHAEFSKHCQDITLVFDKGNNSEKNFEQCTSYHYVGSLVPSQHADLLAIPLEEYTELSKGHKAYVCRKKVFGKEHVICLAFSEELYRCQMRGLRLQLDKREKHLKALQQKLEARKTVTGKRGRKPTVAGVTRMVTTILKGQHMKEVIQYSVGEENGQVFLHYSVDETAISQIAATRFGKNIIFTDRQDMDAATIVETYHTQYKVEDAFKQMKNPHHVSFSPVYHWTDQKLRVHAFYCVLELTLSSLLQRQLHRAGVEISMEKMHEQLSSIKELLLLYPAKNGKVKAVTTLSKKNAIQNQVFKVLDLKRFV